MLVSSACDDHRPKSCLRLYLQQYTLVHQLETKPDIMFFPLTLTLCLLVTHALVASGFSSGANLLPFARQLPAQLQYHRQENDRACMSLQPATSSASSTSHTVTFASISPNTVAVNNESTSANMLTQASYASNGEECPSGFGTPRCDECGGAEQTVGETWNNFHCRGVSTIAFSFSKRY